MQKIIPHLWFDKEAKEAAEFYTSLFPESKITHHSVLRDTPLGDCDIMSFILWGYEFMAISAGPIFKINPSVSFMVDIDPLQFGDESTREAKALELHNKIWTKLSEGGKVIMPLDEYPFSKRYGWIQDKYGVSWQVILSDPNGDPRPNIVPSMLFVGDNAGKAEEAIDYYTSIFPKSKKEAVNRYGNDRQPDKEGTIAYADFKLHDQFFAAMDSAREHNFKFNEAISFLVGCDTQEEIDSYWKKLSTVPEAEQCGWLKDKYGFSWQISSNEMQHMLSTGTPEQVQRVTEAFMPMKKIEIAPIKKAFNEAEKVH